MEPELQLEIKLPPRGPPPGRVHDPGLTASVLLCAVQNIRVCNLQQCTPLRVDLAAKPTLLHTIPTGDIPLRVPTPLRKAVKFAPLPAPTGNTFDNSTGAPEKQRRRLLRRQSQKSSATQPAKTVHHKKLAVSIPPRIDTARVPSTWTMSSPALVRFF